MIRPVDKPELSKHTDLFFLSRGLPDPHRRPRLLVVQGVEFTAFICQPEAREDDCRKASVCVGAPSLAIDEVPASLVVVSSSGQNLNFTHERF